MKKSWSNPLMIAYEIKTSRSDFLNDKKWMNYLNYCNELYFITPINLVDKSEIPEQAGLKYVSSTGTRIYTKKKAPYREIEFPVDLFTYILMWRSLISENDYQKTSYNKEYWKKWLKNKKIDDMFGYKVGKTIQKRIKEEIEKVDDENKILKKENENADIVKKILKKMGFDNPNKFLSTYWFENEFEERLKEIDKGFNKKFVGYISNTINNLEDVKKILSKIKK